MNTTKKLIQIDEIAIKTEPLLFRKAECLEKKCKVFCLNSVLSYDATWTKC